MRDLTLTLLTLAVPAQVCTARGDRVKAGAANRPGCELQDSAFALSGVRPAP